LLAYANTYIYIYREREREKEREKKRKKKVGGKRTSPTHFGLTRIWSVKNGLGQAGPSNRNGPIITTRLV